LGGTPLFVTIDPTTDQLGVTSGGGGGGLTFEGDSGQGSATPSAGVINFNALNTGGGTTYFSGSGSTMAFNASDTNFNTVIGGGSGLGSLPIPGIENTTLGWGALTTVGISGVNGNTGVGFNVLGGLTSGNYNTVMGYFAGTGYMRSESSNIIISCGTDPSVGGESNALHIGAGTGSATGELNQAFISGINGVTLGGTPLFVTIDPSTDQLGVTSGGGGGGVTINCDVGSATGSTLALYAHTGFALAGSSVAFIGNVTEIDLQMTDINDNTMIGSSAVIVQ